MKKLTQKERETYNEGLREELKTKALLRLLNAEHLDMKEVSQILSSTKRSSNDAALPEINIKTDKELLSKILITFKKKVKNAK